jgi:hypothetical protein
MPPTRRSYIQRRLRQADTAMARGIRYIGEIWATFSDLHPEHCPEAVQLMQRMDELRRDILAYHERVDGGSSVGLWRPRDFYNALTNAKPVPNPRNK